MRKPNYKHLCVTAVAGAMCLALLSGCTGGAGTSATERSEGSIYMSQVNQLVSDMATSLDSFSEAASEVNVVSMKTQLEAVQKKVDELKALSVPSGAEKVESSYVDGCNKLTQALQRYTALYEEISAAQAQGTYTAEAYKSKLQEVQDLYNEGIAALEEADKVATDIQ